MATTNEDRLSRRDVLRVLAALGLATPSAVEARISSRRPIRPQTATLDDAPWAPGEVLPAKSVEYLNGIAAKLQQLKPEAIAAHVKSLGRADEEWRRRKCLSLRAAEGIMGAGAQAVLNSSTATRVSEGFPGAKGGSGNGTDRYIDEVEGAIIYLAQKLFHAKYVEWRPISNTMANALPLLALTEPGDVIMSQAMGPGGGNSAYHDRGPGGFKKLAFIDLPFTENYGFDLPAIRALAGQVKPKLIVIGGSFVLFPYPIRELRQIANEVGAKIIYDAAHLALLIAGGVFQQPLDEGADILTLSTHKSFGGPVGGITLTNDAELAEKMLRRTLPGFIQTRDANKLVASAYSFAEVAEFGPAYATQIVQNAKAFGEALDRAEGFKVLARDKGYTETHQVIVNVRDIGVPKVVDLCLQSNILIQGARLLGDQTDPSGLRLSVAELTRLGMKQAQMPAVARFIRRAVNAEDPARLGAEVEHFLEPYQKVHYAFDV
ncbi:MAG: aminotransferase class I/II-fold pyridoxal phosphate-dependent enzyme [Gemmatimonadota bacterium]